MQQLPRRCVRSLPNTGGMPLPWNFYVIHAGGRAYLRSVTFSSVVESSMFEHSRSTLTEHGNIASLSSGCPAPSVRAGVPDGARGIIADWSWHHSRDYPRHWTQQLMSCVECSDFYQDEPRHAQQHLPAPCA